MSFSYPTAHTARVFPLQSQDIILQANERTDHLSSWFGVEGLRLPLLLLAGKLLGAGRYAVMLSVFQTLLRWSSHWRSGREGFSLKIEVEGEKNGSPGSYRCEIYTDEEALVTALPLATSCRQLAKRDGQGGVFTPHQVLQSQPLLTAFQQYDFSYWGEVLV